MKAGHHSGNFSWIQFPHNPVYAMGGGKSGPSLLFYFEQFFFLYLSTHCTKLLVAWKYFIQ